MPTDDASAAAGRRRRDVGAEVARQQRHGVADGHHLAEQGLAQRRRRDRLGGQVRAASPSPTGRRTPSPARRARWCPRAARRWTASRRRAARCRPVCPQVPPRPPRRWCANRSATPHPTPECPARQWLPDAGGPRRGARPAPRCSAARSARGGCSGGSVRDLESASSSARPALRSPSRAIDRRRCGLRPADRPPRRALLSWFVVPHLRVLGQETPGADRERDVDDVGRR